MFNSCWTFFCFALHSGGNDCQPVWDTLGQFLLCQQQADHASQSRVLLHPTKRNWHIQGIGKLSMNGLSLWCCSLMLLKAVKMLFCMRFYLVGENSIICYCCGKNFRQVMSAWLKCQKLVLLEFITYWKINAFFFKLSGDNHNTCSNYVLSIKITFTFNLFVYTKALIPILLNKLLYQQPSLTSKCAIAAFVHSTKTYYFPNMGSKAVRCLHSFWPLLFKG